MNKLKNINPLLQDLIDQAVQKTDLKVQSVEKKIGALEKDLATAKKAKLSASSLDVIKNKIKDCKKMQGFLLSDGLSIGLKEDMIRLQKQDIQLSKNFFKALDKIIENGKSSKLNHDVFDLLLLLSNHFDAFEKSQKNKFEQIKKSNPSLSSADLDVVCRANDYIDFADALKTSMTIMSKAKIAAKHNIPVSDQYPLMTLRSKIAPQCIGTARSELSGMLKFLDDEDKSSMIAMFVGDAKNHYRLGVHILDGNPKKIDDSASMDTASRDGLSQDVWNFARETIYEDVYNSKAIKEHAQKMQLKNAQKQRRSMMKAVGDVSGKSVGRPRKM